MAGTLELVEFNRLTETRAILPHEVASEERMTKVGWGLGLLTRVIDERKITEFVRRGLSGPRDWSILDSPAQSIKTSGQQDKLRIVCGAEHSDNSTFVARAYVESEIPVKGSGPYFFQVGVESATPTIGISRHFFALYARNDAGQPVKLLQVEVTDGGGVFFSCENRVSDVTRVSPAGRLALIKSWGVRNVPEEILTRAIDLRFVGAVMGAMVRHDLLNPYKGQTPERIWKAFLDLDYEGWKPNLPNSPAAAKK